jgi:hypothetical protein
MKPQVIWSVLEESLDILGGYGYPAMDKAAAKLGLEPDFFTWLAAVILFGEERFTTAEFMHMFPYGQTQVNEAFFASAAQQGYLISDGNAAYRASELGLDTARKVFSAADDAIAHLHPLPDQPFQVLVNRLHRLAEASFAMPEPPAHVLLDHKRNMRKLPVTGLINRFERNVSELQGSRDDMFVASWGARQIQGHTWETFDQVVQSNPLTFDDLFDKVKRRVPTRELLAENVQELARRGWVEDASGKIQITAAGRQVRAEVEAETERLFFAPWSCLNESELEELASLTSQLRDGLNPHNSS